MIGITEVLMKIVYFRIFVTEDYTTFVLTCHRKLVSYYLSKGFLILDHKSDSIKNVPQLVKQHIHEIDLHTKYYVMTCNRAISYIANTLNKKT